MGKASAELAVYWPELYSSPVAQELVRLIRRACSAFLQRSSRAFVHGTPMAGSSLTAPLPPHISLWANVHLGGGGTFHGFHAHDDALISGTYYSSTGGVGTPIVFNDPRGGRPTNTSRSANADHESSFSGNWQPRAPFHHQLSYFPRPGELVLWPSWLTHGVPPHSGTEDRVSWSFNFGSGEGPGQRSAAVW